MAIIALFWGKSLAFVYLYLLDYLEGIEDILIHFMLFCKV